MAEPCTLSSDAALAARCVPITAVLSEFPTASPHQI